jgi:hypothetical protein
MILKRNQFFLLALLLLLVIFFIPKIIWLLSAEKAIGEVMMTGHGNLGSALGLSTYQVVKFITVTDTIVFNGEIDLGLKTGSKVPVLYQKNDPAGAIINTFHTVWSKPIVYCMGPLLVLIAFYLMPDVIPKKSRIRVGGRRMITILPPTTDAS